MNVLSLFDGMSCGMMALQRAGIKVDNYYSSEIDKYAMTVSAANYPEIIQVGDITKLDLSTLPKIDLVMGGSPCQGFSVAGKGLAFDDPRSALFFEFVKCVKELNPKYFLLENVNMKKEWLAVIADYMGVEGIKINSALVSAQNRNRWYWSNIPGIEQPKDRGIVLRDILQDDAEEPMYSNIYGGFNEKKPREHFNKSVTIRANSGGGSIPNVKLKDFDKNLAKMTTTEGKAYCLTASYQGAVPHNSLARGQRSMIPVFQDDLKSLPLKSQTIKAQYAKSSKANFERSGTYHATGIKQELYWRKLTPVECERLQTVPDNYTNHVSNTQRYKMLGNGWNVETVVGILKKIKDDI